MQLALTLDLGLQNHQYSWLVHWHIDYKIANTIGSYIALLLTYH